MKELRIVCDGLPGPTTAGGRFIETEDETGTSVKVGLWRTREDGLWELVIVMDTIR